jgi:hypothetical protein
MSTTNSELALFGDYLSHLLILPPAHQAFSGSARNPFPQTGSSTS